ncbi:MAG: hypothetical protein JWM68_5135 [Verrucomicrobiales bacterium]|nr:hypothetical protein [Verrucomicrobiales bacterium]
MIASLATFIDWCFVQKVSMRMPSHDGRRARMEEALQFLHGPDFIPAESCPAQVEFDANKSGVHFRFPTPRPSAFADNNVVHGRLYRCAERWQERPVILLLHGGNMMFGGGTAIGYRDAVRVARCCNRAGFNAATLEAPYHYQRYPRQPAALNLDFLRMAESAAQAVAEIRAMTGWLLTEGCPAVALWGVSMGAEMAGLTACHDTRLASVVMAAPGVRTNATIVEQILWRRVREELQKLRATEEKLDMTPLDLTRGQPVIPKENILLIEAIYDLFTPKEPIEELWQVWGQPDIWRLPYGHLTFRCEPGLTGRVLRWLAPRMKKPTVATT